MRQFTLPDRPTLLIGRWTDAADWNSFLWECENIFNWSERRSQGKRQALLQTTAGAAMNEGKLIKKCEITTLEWLMQWRYEKRTGREQYPEPVHIDQNIALSDEVQVLRDIYLKMRAQNPRIAPVTFRWEQIDGWEIDIALRSHPEIMIGGIRAQYSPKVSGWVNYIGDPPFPWLMHILHLVLSFAFYSQLFGLTRARIQKKEFKGLSISRLLKSGLLYVLYVVFFTPPFDEYDDYGEYEEYLSYRNE